ncbi:MAG: site-specific integrase [Muribaculaceae bacterium]|nr:site-specific integrase [Muribaculaceae bacterium]
MHQKKIGASVLKDTDSTCKGIRKPMATIKIILDSRVKKDGTASLLLLFSDKQCRRKLNLGVSIDASQWIEEKCEVSSKVAGARQINKRIQLIRASADRVILRHEGINLTGEDLFAQVEAEIYPDRAEKKAEKEKNQNSLTEVARRFTELKKPSTRLTYERTLKHIETFISTGQSNVIDEVNKAWLTAFDNYLAESNPSPNARALHLRNLRAVFNYAIDEELTANYPFRRFKIKTVKTEKRSLPVEKLRQILNYPIEEWQVAYRDMFKLSFLLMGINFADMLNLKASDLREGRIVFNRHKTARLYSMKVEPEAMELIEKYAGEKHLLSIMDSRKDYLQYIRQTNNALRKIGDCERSGLGGKKTHNAICPDLSTYWARHTWATIAASLDIPKETIAAALGHGGNTVTDIYIDFDRKKVDEANRRVLDWVLYGIDYRVAKEPKKEAVPKVKRGKKKDAA